MKITWLGHSGFRIEIEQAVLLVDPWLTGNPMFPADRRAEALEGATHVLLSHGHGDHAGDAAAIAAEKGIPVAAIPELVDWLKKDHRIEGLQFNKGGTVDLGGARVTMVNATHSSSLATDGGPVYTGSEAGYMIAGEGHVIYFSGDTDVMADMGVFADLHAPDIGILACGGLFTMDMRRAAYAAKTFFDFRTIIPCHYRTFPLLAQSADELVAALPAVDVREPVVMEPMTF
ncbi:metal-dependent hydrolase [Hoeflea sp.]|uniref:metal-dependent hydrolase n=1 Tax=Hoeflea sp. TaxID=1940281 RepID=UPI0019B36E50|nr:metal-dependent hydrolase [Hoeflea sp.]MBC7283316.1 metal-dependent hydrolase [Hoeflea sp.]